MENENVRHFWEETTRLHPDPETRDAFMHFREIPRVQKSIIYDTSPSDWLFLLHYGNATTGAVGYRSWIPKLVSGNWFTGYDYMSEDPGRNPVFPYMARTTQTQLESGIPTQDKIHPAFVPPGYPALPAYLTPRYFGQDLDESTGPLFQELSETTKMRRLAYEDFESAISDEAILHGQVVVAELDKAHALVSKPLNKLSDEGVKELVKASAKWSSEVLTSRDFRRLRKQVSSTYLEWTYGWKPTIGDIKDGLKAVKSIYNHPKVRYAKSSESTNYSVTLGVGRTQMGSFDYKVHNKLNVKSDIRYKAAVWYDSRRSSSGIALGKLGLLPKQLPSAVWETTRFSFLLDYFVNVQNVITYDAKAFVNVKWAQETFWDRYENILDLGTQKETELNQLYEPFVRTGPATASLTLLSERYEREPIRQFVHHQWPLIRTPTSVQTLNMAALASSLEQLNQKIGKLRL